MRQRADLAGAPSGAAHLRDGRPFLVADEPTVCDFAAYHPLWFAMRAPALAAARAAGGAPCGLLPDADRVDFHGFAPGERVVVTPLDCGLVEVEGELVVSSADRISVRRTDPRAGTLTVHFPRIGFRTARAPLS